MGNNLWTKVLIIWRPNYSLLFTRLQSIRSVAYPQADVFVGQGAGLNPISRQTKVKTIGVDVWSKRKVDDLQGSPVPINISGKFTNKGFGIADKIVIKLKCGQDLPALQDSPDFHRFLKLLSADPTNCSRENRENNFLICIYWIVD